MPRKKKPRLSPLENTVMQVVWQRQEVIAEEVRTQLANRWPMKDSTVRTILRRLEEKGYVKHMVRGRTYVYRPKVPSQSVATDAVRGIVDRFCDGSIETLLVGIVDNELITVEKLQRIAERIAEAEAPQERPRSSRGD